MLIGERLCLFAGVFLGAGRRGAWLAHTARRNGRPNGSAARGSAAEGGETAATPACYQQVSAVAHVLVTVKTFGGRYPRCCGGGMDRKSSLS